MIWIIIGSVAAVGGIGWYARKRYLDKKYGKKYKVATRTTDKDGKVKKGKIVERIKDEDRGYSDEDSKKARKIVKDSIKAGELKLNSTLEGMVDTAKKLDPSLQEKEKPSATRPSFKKSTKKTTKKKPVRRMPDSATKSTKKATKKATKKKAKKRTTKKKPDDKN